MRSSKARFGGVKSRIILLIGGLSLHWGTPALGSPALGCAQTLELRARLESVWSSLPVSPASLSFDEAFTLTLRDAERLIGGRVLTRKDLLDPIDEREFEPVLPLLVAPVLDTFLNEKPKATEPFRQKLEGLASDQVVIVVHPAKKDQSSTGEYLTDKVFQGLPVLALVSTTFPLSEPGILSHLTMARYSEEGELRDIRINADEVHLMGGAFGDCLTTATAQALDQMLNYPHRDKAVAHLYLQASWGWKPCFEQWVGFPAPLLGERLFKDFGDRSTGEGYRNKALDPFKFVEATSTEQDSPYYELKLERMRDGKKAFVRLHGIDL
jgi:hypothetical protein